MSSFHRIPEPGRIPMVENSSRSIGMDYAYNPKIIAPPYIAAERMGQVGLIIVIRINEIEESSYASHPLPQLTAHG